MAGDKLPGFNAGKARGNRLPAPVKDELDAETAAHVRTAYSSTRRAMDERYGAEIDDTGYGFAVLQVGGTSDDDDEETPTPLEFNRYRLIVGDGEHDQHTVPHNLGTLDVEYVIRRNGGDFGKLYGCKDILPNENTLILLPGEIWAPAEYVVTVSAIVPQGTGPDTGGGTGKPTAPTLTATNTTSASITVAATGATDPGGGIVAYNYYRGGALVGTGGSTYTYTGLTANTAYSLNATAVDGDGNESNLSGTITPTTTASASVSFAGANGLRVGGVNNVVIPITVPAGTNREMLAWGFTTHQLWKNITAFATLTAVSDVDGTFGAPHAMISIRGASGQEQGAIVLWHKHNATVGAHNITITVDDPAVAELHTMGAVQTFSGVASLDAAVTARHDAAGSPISLAIPSAVGNYTAYASLSGDIGTSAQPTDYNQTERYAGGVAVINGLGKWARVGDAPGGTSVVHSETTSLRNVAIGVNLVKA